MNFSILPQAPEGAMLYSRYAAYHIISGNATVTSSRTQLFGNSSVCWLDPFGSAFYKFKTHAGAGLIGNERHLLRTGTFVGFYSAFLPKNVAVKWESDLLHGIRRRQNPMGAHKPFKHSLNFCKECVLSDLKTFGIAHWRVVHQLPGVRHCPAHGCSLFISCKKCGHSAQNAFAAETPRVPCGKCGGAEFASYGVIRSKAYKNFLDICHAASTDQCDFLRPENRKRIYFDLFSRQSALLNGNTVDFLRKHILSSWKCTSLEQLPAIVERKLNVATLKQLVDGTFPCNAPSFHLTLLATLGSAADLRKLIAS